MHQRSWTLLARLPWRAAGRRAAAPAPGHVRLGERDVAGLLLCGDVYGVPYDLLAAFLSVRADRARGILARWRRAGYVPTARLGPGHPGSDGIEFVFDGRGMLVPWQRTFRLAGRLAFIRRTAMSSSRPR